MDLMRFNDLYRRLRTRGPESDGVPLLDEFHVIWSEAESRGIDLDTLEEATDNCLRHIATTTLFPLAACKWIGQLGHEALNEALLHHVSVRFLQHRQLLRFELPEGLEGAAVTAAKRMCAMSVPVAVSLGWILSLNESRPCNPELKSSIAKVVGLLAAE